jgi:hypothetical protein
MVSKDEDNGESEGESILQTEETSANMKARVMHLALEPGAVIILDSIFRGCSKKGRREALDDKLIRTPQLWKQLADEFFNSATWTPVN